MGTSRKVRAQKCATVAKKIIQAAELACYGSLQLIHKSCDTGAGQKSRMIDRSSINHYIDIIVENSNCTASLERLDNKKVQSYQLCKAMADRLNDVVIDAYVPPVPVIPETRRRYSLRSLGLADDNFNLVTGEMISMLITIMKQSLLV